MSDSQPKSQPVLWMIMETPSSSSSEGKKSGGVLKKVGLIGDDEEKEETVEAGKISLSVNKLQQNLQQFLGVVGDLFIQAEQQGKIAQSQDENEPKPGIQLDGIELSVAINAEGEVGFWGLAKGKVGGATEIKLTFKRKES